MKRIISGAYFNFIPYMEVQLSEVVGMPHPMYHACKYSFIHKGLT